MPELNRDSVKFQKVSKTAPGHCAAMGTAHTQYQASSQSKFNQVPSANRSAAQCAYRAGSKHLMLELLLTGR